MRPKNLYVVINGRKLGVFNLWDGENGVKQQVHGFSGALYKGGFFSIDEAVYYFKDNKGYNPEINFNTELLEDETCDLSIEYITYMIVDPQLNHPYYVGQTANYPDRKRQHLVIRKKISRRKVEIYTRTLLDSEIEPRFIILDKQFGLIESLKSETQWVYTCLSQGYNLTNCWKEHRKLPVNWNKEDELKFPNFL